VELFPDRTAIPVTGDPQGAPVRLRPPGRPWTDVTCVCNQWVVDTDWWKPPSINRAYYRVLVGRDGCELYEVYEDRTTGTWYVSRRYD